MLQLMNREWRTFNIGALFQVKRPKTRVESQYLAGNSPFVASGAVNNGVTGFYQATSEEQLDKGNCITVSPVDGTAFWQSSDFLGRGGAGSAILLLYNNFLNKYSGMFMTRMIQKTCSKYSYGNMGNQKNIVREVVMLLVDNAGKPDYAFMEEYIKEREQQLIQKYIAHVRNTSVIIGGGITPLHEKDWRCFVLGDLFTLIPGKGKGANHLKTAKQGGISYLGATNRNNAVLGFVEPVEGMVQKGNCIAFIRNGEGSMGYAVYKQEDFISTADITLGYAPFLNMYVGFFITTVADKVRGKYVYNYKRSDTRLRKELLLLPVDSDGQPDWQYMEQYAKMLMAKVKLQYLQTRQAQ